MDKSGCHTIDLCIFISRSILNLRVSSITVLGFIHSNSRQPFTKNRILLVNCKRSHLNTLTPSLKTIHPQVKKVKKKRKNIPSRKQRLEYLPISTMKFTKIVLSSCLIGTTLASAPLPKLSVS